MKPALCFSELKSSFFDIKCKKTEEILGKFYNIRYFCEVKPLKVRKERGRRSKA